ncbi:MAG TPA: ankyrin repeat domain-containing protein [Chthonomonadaceae bacterium]|nr:ankyrin repeat domain-containing protein [Chthonomonadaceae bacterium]
MKRRRTLLLPLLVLLLIVGIPAALTIRTLHQEQSNHALIAAIRADDTQAALAALKAGADPNVRDPTQDKPLSFGERMKEFLDRILQSHTTSGPDERPTPLLLSLEAREDNCTLVSALLDAGANPNLIGDTKTLSPVMSAALRHSPETLRLLLQHGGDCHLKDRQNGWTALHYAAWNREPANLSMLLDAGADINAQDKDGYTPLHWACMLDNILILQALLQHHACVNIRDKNGRTALDAVSQEAMMSNLLRRAGAKTGAELDAARSTNPNQAENQESRNP